MTVEVELFDPPGPRGRFRNRVGSAIALVMIAILGAIILGRLDSNGQLDSAKWSPLINPRDDNFYALWGVLGRGLVLTLIAAVLAITSSLVLGTLFAVVRQRLGRVAQIPVIGVIELLRGLPLVITLYYISRVLPDAGVTLSDAPGGRYLWYLVIGLTAYNTVVIAEGVRAGIESLPRGQREAAESIGLTDWQVMRLILLPQAFRVILPVLISQLIVIVKDTSLAALVLGRYQEFLRAASLAVQDLHNPLQIFFAVAVVYILINLLLSKVAEHTQRMSSRSSRPSVLQSASTD